MANPQDTGTFDYWIADRIMFETIPPRAGNTGTFDGWLTDRIYFHDYVEAEVAGGAAGGGAFLAKSPLNSSTAWRARHRMLG